MFLTARGGRYSVGSTQLSILTPGINQSSRNESGGGNSPVLSVCQYGLSVLDMACQFMACCSSLLSCGENNPNPKSDRYLDPDMLRCTISCQRDEIDPTFSCTFFWICVSHSQHLQPTLESWSRSRIGSSETNP